MRKTILIVTGTLIALAISLLVGPSGLPDNPNVVRLRLIRTALAFIAGMSLSVNGAALQSLFGNPLVDPHIIGISGGAALGFVIATLIGMPFSWAAAVAVMGGWLTTAFVYFISVENGYVSRSRLLLGGISTGTFASSLVMALLAVKGESALYAIRFLWGYVGVVMTQKQLCTYGLSSLVIIAASVRMWLSSRELDAIYLGDSEALAIGVDIERLKKRVFLLASLSTGVLVAMVGIIGFIGLIVPHMARKLLRTGENLRVIPASAVLGGVFAVTADTVARTLFPVELPLGVITSLVGVPIFIYLIKAELNGA